MSAKPNRLIREKSPYLLQHAHNPVDWHPWSEETFALARAENKPVFLSIGYSTCHWCHVMERESFEDEEAAALLNETFICVKVDREERPDIDSVYMTVCQLMTGQGGWPLTILMTPDKKPFFAATYIPRDTRFGRMGLTDLAPRIKRLWLEQGEDVLASAESVVSQVRSLTLSDGMDEAGQPLADKAQPPDHKASDAAFRELAKRYDSVFGGFGTAPKFPTPHNLLFLLRYFQRTSHPQALDMVRGTLGAMRRGGLFDQVGFGFHRYSTDRVWHLPHFEKMLYDQALLALAYTEAWQATGPDDPERDGQARTVEEIFQYILRDLLSPEGGFHSAEDADSEGEEGKFYVFTLDEAQTLLRDEAELVIEAYDLRPEGNFEDEASGQKTGANILSLKQPLSALAKEWDLDEATLRQKLARAGQTLLQARDKRVRPHKDDKILTDWNGLVIAALARAARVFDRKDWLAAANRAADFLLATLRDENGRLLHRYRDGEAALPAHLDDYAFLVWGLIELHQAGQDTGRLVTALELTEEMIELFWDEPRGGFYLTARDVHDGEGLPYRPKETGDAAMPSGNSAALMNLLRLSRLLGRPDFEAKAETLLGSVAEQVLNHPSGHCYLLCGLDQALGRAPGVVVAGDKDDPRAQDLLNAVKNPDMVVLLRDKEVRRLAPYTASMGLVDGAPAAYLCVDKTCKDPVTGPEELKRLLQDV